MSPPSLLFLSFITNTDQKTQTIVRLFTKQELFAGEKRELG